MKREEVATGVRGKVAGEREEVTGLGCDRWDNNVTLKVVMAF